MHTEKVNNSKRISGLDSLRGIAAAAVVLAHVFDNLVTGHTLDEYTPLYIFRAAHEAVIFFFLLSGFVLAYQSSKQIGFNYISFLIQRFFRIYVPYLIITLLVILLFIWARGAIIPGTEGNHAVWSTPVSIRSVMDHILLIGNFNTNVYNPVIWSLVHEMRLAIAFPVIMWIVSLPASKSLACAFFLSLLAAIGIVSGVEPIRGYNNSFLYSIHYMGMFIVGGLLVKHNRILMSYYTGLSVIKRKWLLMLAVLLFCYSRMLYLIPHKLGHFSISHFNEFFADWLTSSAAAIFILYASQVQSKKNILLRSFPLFLGRISYSLYLLHLPVMLALLYLFPDANKILMMGVAVPVAIAGSYLSHQAIEKPAAKLGKRISSHYLIRHRT